MNKVYKYEVKKIAEPQTIEFPIGSIIVHAGVQHHKHESKVYVWAIVDPEEKTLTQRVWQLIGTGHDIPKDSNHVFTVIDGPWVWHVFDLGDDFDNIRLGGV